MNGKLDIKQIITSVITTLICGTIFIIIIPIIALFFLDVFISFISVFDPLHQGDNINKVWGPFIGIIIVQTIFGILASIATGIAISFLTDKVKTGSAYLLGMVVSLGIYGVLQAISVSFIAIFAAEIVVVSWMFLSLAIVGFFSIIIGLTNVAVNRKMIGNNSLDR